MVGNNNFIDFDKFVVMKEKFLKKLNKAVDRIIKEKEYFEMDYDFIEKALKGMLKGKKSIFEPEESVKDKIMNKRVNDEDENAVIPINNGQALKLTLDFYKSIDPELYKQVINIILQQNKSIKMNVYNVHDVEDFDTIDENNLKEYSHGGVFEANNRHAIISIPARTELNKEADKKINKEKYTLDDLYTIVHEIGHCLDWDLDYPKVTSKNLVEEDITEEVNITREFTCEATTIALEILLSEYLKKNKLYPKVAVDQISKGRIKDSLKHAKNVYMRLLLAKEKEEKGEITLDFIEKTIIEYNISITNIRNMAQYIIEAKQDMYMHSRYAMGGLIAPTIVKAYKTKGASALKGYLGEAKNRNLESALKEIGIELNEQGINELVSNYNQYIHTFDEKER